MKRKLIVALSCISLSLAVMACESKDATQTTNSQDSEKTEQAVEKFVGTDDLVVNLAYVYDGDVFVEVENKSDKPILDFKVAYIAFDQNGFPATTDGDGYRGGNASAANILPGGRYITSWYGAGSSSKYTVATVTGITYADGSEWRADCINIWADEAKKSFSVDSYNDLIRGLYGDAEKAESNEYAKLSNERMKHDNQFSTKSDYHFKVTNTGNKGISKVGIFVLEFDKNGYAVDVSPYDKYCKNGLRTGGTINVAAGKSDEFVDDLFFEGETKSFKSVIYEIEFQDGTTWSNPYLQAWILTNK